MEQGQRNEEMEASQLSWSKLAFRVTVPGEALPAMAGDPSSCSKPWLQQSPSLHRALVVHTAVSPVLNQQEPAAASPCLSVCWVQIWCPFPAQSWALRVWEVSKGTAGMLQTPSEPWGSERWVGILQTPSAPVHFDSFPWMRAENEIPQDLPLHPNHKEQKFVPGINLLLCPCRATSWSFRFPKLILCICWILLSSSYFYWVHPACFETHDIWDIKISYNLGKYTYETEIIMVTKKNRA